MPREAVDPTALAEFRERLDKALSSLVEWEVYLCMTGGTGAR